METQVDETMLEPLLYEDSVIASHDVSLQLPSTEALWEDFHLLASALPLFSNLAIINTMLTAFFTSRYGSGGRCSDMLRFLLDARQALADDFAQLATGFTSQGRFLHVPDALRRYAEDAQRLLQLRKQFLADLIAMSSTDHEEVELDRKWLRNIAWALPASARIPWQHYAYLCQSVPREEGDLLVINSITDGWGKHLATHCNALMRVLGNEQPENDLGQALQASLTEIAPPGHEFVEIAGGNGFNANIHPPLTPRELVLPGEWSSRPTSQQMLLTDLEMMHDVATNRLRLFHKQDGREIHLLYPGLLTPGLLGPFHRLLLPFTQTFFWIDESLVEAFIDAVKGSKEEEIIRYPRMRLGQLVLSRRKWLTPASCWPRWEGRELLNVAQLLELERWRRQADIPAQVFVRPALSKHVKPQFVDFQHALLLSAVPRRLRSIDGWFKVEEALPSPREYCTRPDGGHVATAFWIEMRF